MKIPVYEPDLSGNESKYLLDCIETSWISSKGKYIDLFEEKFSQYTKLENVTTVFNGTVALHLALLALDLKEGDEVIVPSFTYIASVNAIKYVGAKPVFIDVDPATWQIDLTQLDRVVTKKSKAVMAVHLYGATCNMSDLQKYCQQRNLYLIEDAAEALGTTYAGKHVGHFSDISTFSFFGNKTITTGEGGIVASPHHDLMVKIRKLKNQGLSSYKEYWHDVIGYNYRMTNMQAAIGCAQLERLNIFLDKKSQLNRLYESELQDCPVDFQKILPECNSSYWMNSILTKNSDVAAELRGFLLDRGVETRPVFPLVSQMPPYGEYNQADFPISCDLSHRGINLPSAPLNFEIKTKKVIELIKEYYGI